MLDRNMTADATCSIDRNDPHQTHTRAGPLLPQAIRDGADYDVDYRFVESDGEHKVKAATLVRAIDERAVQLQQAGLRKGDRVGFVVPDNYAFLVTFLGALQLGVIPVPMFPPLSMGKLDAYRDGAKRILDTAGAVALITTRQVQPVLWSLLDRVPTLQTLLCTEDFTALDNFMPLDISHVGLDDTAFLQFTSGSTAAPKGVIVSHRSLLANMTAIGRDGLRLVPEQDSAVSWLPTYHDMGLIGFMLTPLWYMGRGPVTFISTLSFLKNPAIWLETVSAHRGTVSFAPNFAFALAVRRTPPERVAQLDLSCLKILGCGAEPNHPGTLRRFLEHFAPAGLDPGALMPCYGMAEATLAMSFRPLGSGMKTDWIQAEPYHDAARAVPAVARTDSALEIVSCGHVLPDHRLRIVDAHFRDLPERQIGEIIFDGPSVAPGYYRQNGTDTFTSQGLRTGDLGYLADGELYVTGRQKDLIILNGRNYDPQLIEWEVNDVDGVRKGGVIAFSRPGNNTEELVIVAERQTPRDVPDLAEQIRQRVRENLRLNPVDVVLLAAGQLPKTSSGKLQRQRTRKHYLEGVLGREGVRTPGQRGQLLILTRHVLQSMWSRLRHRMRRNGLRRRPD